MLTQERLKELLHYCPDTGIFTHIKARQKVRVGSVAGYFNGSAGYMQICVDYKIHLSHRIAWLYVTGDWPTNEIDHINGNQIDNRFINLREATRDQNCSNRKVKKSSTTGLKGVERAGNNFQARIRSKGIRYCLGTYSTKEDAHAAYIAASKKLHGDFSNSGAKQDK